MAQTSSTNGAAAGQTGPDFELSTVADAIVRTVAYVDVFDYPLTAAEVHRYLVGVAAPPQLVFQALESSLMDGMLTRRDEFFTLMGRQNIVDERRRRGEIAKRLWPHARHFGRTIGALPFVRMVSVTGSLAVDNVTPGADIDYLIVTEPGRLWLSRAFTILIVRLAARRGVHLCPNYFLSQNALVFDEQNLYTAHELVQMVPIAGSQTYRRMRRLNGWTNRFLPNADRAPRPLAAQGRWRPGQLAQTVVERALRTPAGAWLERWEMRRKITRFLRDNRAGEVEAAFCADWCKGHFDGHGHRIMQAYQNRITKIGR